MTSPTKTSGTTTSPLSERNANAPVLPQKKAADGKLPVKSSLEDTSNPISPVKLNHDNNNSGTYISPSDAIMSPASQKLAGMKGRRFASAKPKSLFAKTVSQQHNKSSSSFSSKLKQQEVQDQVPEQKSPQSSN